MTHQTDRLQRALCITSLALLLNACGLISFGQQDENVQARPPATHDSAEAAQCHRVLDTFSAFTADAGVHDAQQVSDEAYPQYRYDRFLASYSGRFSSLLEVSDEAGHWLDRMYGLADKATRIEWRNLPAERKNQLNQRWGLTGTDSPGGLTLLRSCLRRLHQATRSDPRAVTRLARGMWVPGEYDRTRRLLGAYWAVRGFAASGLEDWQEQMRQRQARAVPAGIELVPQGKLLPAATLKALLQQASRHNPLGIPDPETTALRELSHHFAPQLRVDVQNGADSVSTLRWGRSGELETLITRPTAYVMPSWTRWQGKALLQLNYLYWFPRRIEAELMDPYAGRLDGIMWRVTLKPDGSVLFYDSIHPCGCYHTVYPVAQGLRVSQPDGDEPVLVYAGAPDAARTRIEIQVSSGDHQIVAVRKAAQLVRAADSIMPEQLQDLGIGDQDRVSYDLRDYNELRTLPLREGGHRSLFDSNGIVPGTERIERYYLWPMGVPSAGSMRQWGHHATAFTSRRHFDDPDLIPRLFE